VRLLAGVDTALLRVLGLVADQSTQDPAWWPKR